MSDKSMDYLAGEMVETVQKNYELADRLNGAADAIRQANQERLELLKKDAEQYEEGTPERAVWQNMITEIEKIIQQSEEI